MKAMPSLLADNRRKQIISVIALALVQALATALAAICIRDIFGSLHSDDATTPVGGFFGLCLAGIIISVARCYHKKIAEVLGQSYAMSVRAQLYRHLSRLPISSLNQKRKGALALRFVGDLSAVKNWIANGVTQLIAAAFIIPAATFALWWLSPPLAMAALPPIAIAFFILLFAARPLKALHQAVRRERANLSIEIMERVSVAPLLRLMGRSRKDNQLLKNRGSSILQNASKRAFAKSVLQIIPDIGCAFASVALLITAYFTNESAATAAGALAVIGILGLPLRELASVWDRRCAWLIAKDKYLRILDMPTLKREKTDKKIPQGSLAVDVEGMCFGPLQQLSLTIPKSSKVVLIGSAGSGKTSLLNLLAGLEDAQQGTVRLNGMPMPQARVAGLGRRVHYLSKKSPVLQGSFRRALTLGLRRRPHDTVLLEKVAAFGLDDLLKRLDGLDGRIDEGAANLSQGEIFRVLILRASLQQPDLLLIDDDIADTQEKDRLDLLCDLLSNSEATVVMVSGNPRLMRQADTVYYLEKGRLINFNKLPGNLKQFLRVA